MDFFWTLSTTDRFNIYEEPSAPTIGQISESLEWIHRMTNDPSEVVPSYLATCLGDVLMVLGRALGSIPEPED